jgi:hypothetical protein
VIEFLQSGRRQLLPRKRLPKQLPEERLPTEFELLLIHSNESSSLRVAILGLAWPYFKLNKNKMNLTTLTVSLAHPQEAEPAAALKRKPTQVKVAWMGT